MQRVPVLTAAIFTREVLNKPELLTQKDAQNPNKPDLASFIKAAIATEQDKVILFLRCIELLLKAELPENKDVDTDMRYAGFYQKLYLADLFNYEDLKRFLESSEPSIVSERFHKKILASLEVLAAFCKQAEETSEEESEEAQSEGKEYDGDYEYEYEYEYSD